MAKGRKCRDYFQFGVDAQSLPGASKEDIGNSAFDNVVGGNIVKFARGVRLRRLKINGTPVPAPPDRRA